MARSTAQAKKPPEDVNADDIESDGDGEDAAQAAHAAPAGDDKAQASSGDDASGEAAADRDDTSENADPALRLDDIGAADDEHAQRRTFDLNDDDEDASFGPKLAAWLAAYRARQAASAEGYEPPQRVSMTPHPAVGNASAITHHHAPAVPPPGRNWAGRAQVAFDDMLAQIKTSPPPEWIAERHRPAPRQRGDHRALKALSLVVLMAGTATVAFIAAARNAGVEVSIDRFASVFAAPSPETAAPQAAAPPAAPIAPIARGDALEARGGPQIEVVPTRIVAASAPVLPAPEPIEYVPAGPLLASAGPVAAAVRDIEPTDHPRARIQSANAAGTVRTTMVPVARPAPPEPPLQTVEAVAPAPRQVAMAASTVSDAPPIATAPEPAPPPALPVQAGEARAPVQIASAPAAIREAAPPPIVVASPSVPDPGGLLTRARALLSQGDVLAARLIFEQLARSGHPEAALGAGMTYDPELFEQIGARGIEPDAQMAIGWYNTALGSGEKNAIDQIERLEMYIAR